MDYFSALLEPGDLFTLKQAFQGQGNAMLIGYDLPRLDCTALSTPADESSPIHLILTWYGEGHSLFLNPNLKHKKVMSFRNVRVVLWIAPPSDLFIFNVDKYSNYVRNDRSTNLVYLFDEAPGLRDIKVTHVEDCWLGRFNLLFKVDNLRTQGSQPIFDQYHETYGAILTGFPAKDIRKQYKSQTSHTSSSTEAKSLALKSDFHAAGFTALISDRHSRRAKYMQALALGLPCLSAKWISTCVSRGTVVDWSSYVLCAGSSRVLGGAICSRNIPIYEASSKALPETLEEKPAFLRKMRILAVLQKGSQRKHMPYFVLLQMLGATLVGAKSIEEAMTGTEGSGHTFDFIYTPGQGANAENSRSITNYNYPLHGTSILTDETLIQSIILGRLVQEDEMEG
ncbi:chromatin-binding protein RAD9 [Apiospora kogelbergensis]|uniref:Chromatin-binding protein RAD9 n=1 Tax=Apiospora kogelbergensis TaxID=1337665 RepID=A0AAW0QZG2_9PEZI